MATMTGCDCWENPLAGLEDEPEEEVEVPLPEPLVVPEQEPVPA
jgi:hypothetical protein